MKKILFSAVLFLLSSIISFGQFVEQPVKWKTNVVELGSGVFEVQVIGEITDNDWHIYDLGPYENGPTATSVKIIPTNDFNLEGSPYLNKKINREYDKIFEMNIGLLSGKFTISQRIKSLKDQSYKVSLIVEWQSCDDQSCLPPTDEEFIISIPKSVVKSSIIAEQKPSNIDTVVKIRDIQPLQKDTEEQEIVKTVEPVQSSSIWLVILEAIIWGFVALITPCVFPMVPMTVSFFLKSGEGKSKSKGRVMASFYGLSIVALYTIPIAIIIGVTYFAGGATITADIFNWVATHWIPNTLFFLIFMVFAASFFGAFEITMPSWLVNKSDEKSDKGGYLGVFFMALTLVLVSFSCTGPIVGTVLIKSTQGEIWQPIVTMLAFSAAFALPFTIFAFAPSLLKDLPKSGGWLNNVKVVLGFLEIALGLKFLSVADQTYHWGILDREIYLAIWIVVFTLLGFYLLGKLRFKHDDEPAPLTVKRLTLSIIVFSFVVYMIPGMWGAPLKALSGYLPPITTIDFNIDKQGIQDKTVDEFKPKYSDILHLPHNLKGFFEYDEAIEYAKSVNKALFVDFTGHGCVNCREMEARVWSDPRVLKLLNDNFVILALYADDKTEALEEDWVVTENGTTLKSIGKINSYIAMSKYGVNAQPYYAIIDPTTEEHLTQPRGYNLDIDAYISFLNSGKK